MSFPAKLATYTHLEQAGLVVSVGRGKYIRTVNYTGTLI